MTELAPSLLAVLALAPVAVLGASQEAATRHDCAALRVSALPPPSWYASECLGQTAAVPATAAVSSSTFLGDTVYYKRNFPAPGNVQTAPLETLAFSIKGPNARSIFAMDFDNTATTLWGIDNVTREIGTIDLDTGAFTPVSTLTGPAAGDNISGLKFDPTSGVAYISVITATVGQIYSVNLTTGLAALVGPTTGHRFIIDIAISPSGQMYAHDVELETLLSINKITGAAVTIGPTGLVANFAQGMDFDVSTGVLYGFAFVISPAQQGELVTFNLATGAATVVAGPVPDELEGAIKTTTFARGDFNADGKTDILWRHDASGENVVWYMSGPVMTGGTFTAPAALTDTRWKMVGTHDFNADLKTDILWRHDTSGENVLWFMEGTGLVSGTFLTPAALEDVNWKMAGTGDFNGDGKPDIAWHHRTAGQIVLWYMNGSVLAGGTFTTPSSLPDLDWKLVGVGSFSLPADNTPDFVWRNQVTGDNLIWFMNGDVKTGEAYAPTVSDRQWQIVAIGEYNFDHKDDWVWRHATSGENAMWFMNGAALLGSAFTTPRSFPDVHWKMVGPR